MLEKDYSAVSQFLSEVHALPTYSDAQRLELLDLVRQGDRAARARIASQSHF